MKINKAKKQSQIVERKPKMKKRAPIDIPFFVLVMALLAFGLVMLFSASYVTAFNTYGDSFHYLKAQLFAAILGIGVMIGMIFLSYKVFKKYAKALMVINLILLVLVLIIGKEVNGGKRWLEFGPLNFQPSEITKLAVVVYLSYYISNNLSKMRDFLKGVLPCLIVIGVNCILIVLEHHFSGTILVASAGLVLLFVSGVPTSWFVIAGGAMGGVLAYVILFTNYAKRRIDAWLDPFSDAAGKGWQTIQSLYAVGSGGVMGLGLGNSIQKHLYMPEAHNDFIFSIVCEELGLVGALFVILLFALLIWRGFVIALNSRDTFARLLVIGIMTLITLQVLLNIAVVTNFIPVTGISMPFFSYGGTSLLILLFEMGIVLNVSRYNIKMQKV